MSLDEAMSGKGFESNASNISVATRGDKGWVLLARGLVHVHWLILKQGVLWDYVGGWRASCQHESYTISFHPNFWHLYILKVI